MSINKKITAKKISNGRFAFTVIVVIIVILELALVSGCSISENNNSGQKTEEQEEEAIAEVNKQAEIRNEFEYIDKIFENIEIIFDFIDENISDSDPELASEMVYSAISLCEGYRQEFAEKLSDPDISGNIFALSSEVIVDGALDLEAEALRDINNEKVMDAIQEAISKKYRLITIEGMIEPVVDYEAYGAYTFYLSREMKDYINIKTDESGKPAVIDGGINITSEDFVERIIKSMEYLENYPDSPRFDEISNLKDRMLWIYLGGIDNSRVFGSEGRIIPEKLEEFENIIDRYSGTEFADILSSYLDLLEEENYTRTDRVEEFIGSLYEI
jgi:hypothetical protein